MLKLLLKDSKGYREQEFPQDSVTIGRAADSTIVLDHTKVSRNHARIERAADGYRISDLGSGNGTVVNGTKVISCVLFRGDQIRIGETEILVLDAGLPAPVPSAAPAKSERVPPPAPPPSAPPPYPTPSRATRTTDRIQKIATGKVAREAASVLHHLVGKLLGVLLILAVLGIIIFSAFQIHRNRATSEAAAGAGSNGSDPSSGRVSAPPDRAGRPSMGAQTADVETRVRAALREGRYRQATEVLEGYAAVAAGSESQAIATLTLAIRETVAADFRNVDAEGRRLQDQGRFEDAARHYATNAGRFEGTEHYRYLSRKPDLLDRLARARAGTKNGTEPVPAPPRETANPPSEEMMGQASSFDILKAYVILQVQEGVPVDFVFQGEAGAAGLGRVVGANDTQVRIDTGQVEQPMAWRQLGEAGLLGMCRSLAPGAPVPIQAAYLRLAVKLGQGGTPENRALLAKLKLKSASAAREIEEALGPAPEAPPSPAPPPVNPLPVNPPPPPKPPENPPGKPGDPPPPAPPPADPP
jgi:hypothetical protein